MDTNAPNSQDSPKHEGNPDIVLYSAQPRVREILVAGLIHCNYRIFDTGSPYLAVVHTSRFHPSVVVVDITESNTKGFLIAAALSKSDKTRTIPVVLMLPAEPEDLLEKLRVEYGDGNRKMELSPLVALHYPVQFTELADTINNIVDAAPTGSE
jgi:response regulator RpfG family c-di-GMP phosphodiesterase